ncbi:MAG: amidohydrolase [Sphingomonadaceae bacterium]|nr:amidohydrolase [Sphingomonadaceae bacterium]
MATQELTRDAVKDEADTILAVSSDSHITEPPEMYLDFIDPEFRDRAPYVAVDDDKGGEAFFVDGFARPIALGLLAAAGKQPHELKLTDEKFSDLHRSGWDPAYRVADQDRDGVQAEFIYPTVGMLLCNHPDAQYKNACSWAYNRWLETYVGAVPDRLYGLGQIIMISPEQAIADLRKIKDMGFKGAMLASEPETDDDYDQPLWDPFWAAAVEMEMPISFHVLTGGMTKSFIEGNNVLSGVQRTGKALREAGRGPGITRSFNIVRNCQDILAMFIFGRVFERHPDLKVVCVEADAGWAPHYMYRMDHQYKRHRHWSGFRDLSKLPSEFFRENIYLTFQDDFTAFEFVSYMNPRRLMWASDFPHSDSTWPWSQDVIAAQTGNLSQQEKEWILRDNCAELYQIDVI